jgi:hypothetical protein
MKGHCAATIVLVSLAATGPARAGYWNYGCKGNLDDTTIEFDRNALLIMPKELAKGDIAGLVKDEIFAFDAADNNSGFQPTMNFARGAFPDQKVVLTEKSSKTVSTQTGHLGTREKDHDHFSQDLSLSAARLERSADQCRHRHGLHRIYDVGAVGAARVSDLNVKQPRLSFRGASETSEPGIHNHGRGYGFRARRLRVAPE